MGEKSYFRPRSQFSHIMRESSLPLLPVPNFVVFCNFTEDASMLGAREQESIHHMDNPIQTHSVRVFDLVAVDTNDSFIVLETPMPLPMPRIADFRLFCLPIQCMVRKSRTQNSIDRRHGFTMGMTFLQFIIRAIHTALKISLNSMMDF